MFLDDETSAEAFAELCEVLSRAEVPDGIAQAFAGGRLTALAKPGEGVRSIVAGNRMRSLVARTLAQQFGDELQAATEPSPRARELMRPGCC